MRDDVVAKVWAVALAAGAVIYTGIQNAAWWPDLAQPVALNMRIFGLVLRATSLLSVVSVVALIGLWLATWKIRGEWIYQENTGYWGHARISVSWTRLRYAVDIYKNKSDLLTALREDRNVAAIGHGDDRISFLDPNGRFNCWYHVPASLDYPERHGTLTLTPTNSSNNYHGLWERTGVLGPAAGTSGDRTAAELKRKEKQQQSGTFKFFVKKRIFLSQN